MMGLPELTKGLLVSTSGMQNEVSLTGIHVFPPSEAIVHSKEGKRFPTPLRHHKSSRPQFFAEELTTRRVRAAFPGVGDTIRALHRQGYPLHTASGESSLDLEGYLYAMGARDCFGRLYGPDLIGSLKEGPEYYERIFADLGIATADTLVVDDSPRAIEWARQVGARTVLVGDSSLPRTGATVYQTAS
jgi:HAD superfamily hydrolase (TIGR01509 family)